VPSYHVAKRLKDNTTRPVLDTHHFTIRERTDVALQTSQDGTQVPAFPKSFQPCL